MSKRLSDAEVLNWLVRALEVLDKDTVQVDYVNDWWKNTIV